MNLSASEIIDYSSGTDIFSVLGEPEDPGSDWHELRAAQLASCDYIFVSSQLNSKLANATTLNEFVGDLLQVMETDKDRAKMFIYQHNSMGGCDFFEISVNWKGGIVKDFHINPVKNVEQKDFVRTLFDHSEVMLGTVE